MDEQYLKQTILKWNYLLNHDEVDFSSRIGRLAEVLREIKDHADFIRTEIRESARG